jgi:hypothetical protein
MFDWFHTQNDNERNVWRPRVIFATLRHSARPILSEQGYRAFSVATFWIWAFGLFFVWVFKVEVSLSKDLITSIAGSSVELAALSLAVLGIIHELNEKDKWFKLGLFLVAVLFACVVFGGYFLVATWQPAFDTTQRITVVIVCAIGMVAVTQIEWRAVFKLFRVQCFLNFTLPLSFSAGARRFRLVLPFLMPIFVLWFPNLKRLTATIVLFSGALIALVALMGVTLILFLFAPKEKETEDPLLVAIRESYEYESEVFKRISELKAHVVKAMKFLQDKKVQMARLNNEVPTLLHKSSIIVRLRQMDITDDEKVLGNVLFNLVNDGRIYRKDYDDSFWIIPDKNAIDHCLKNLAEIALIFTERGHLVEKVKKPDFTIEGYKFDALRAWLAVRGNMPEHVIGTFVMPKVLSWLHDPLKFKVISYTIRDEQKYSYPKAYDITIIETFVNLMWATSDTERTLKAQEIDELMVEYRQVKSDWGYERIDASEKILNNLPHTMDAHFHLLPVFKFEEIISTLKQQL